MYTAAEKPSDNKMFIASTPVQFRIHSDMRIIKACVGFEEEDHMIIQMEATITPASTTHPRFKDTNRNITTRGAAFI